MSNVTPVPLGRLGHHDHRMFPGIQVHGRGAGRASAPLLTVLTAMHPTVAVGVRASVPSGPGPEELLGLALAHPPHLF